MVYYFYDILDERHISILVHSINNFDNDNFIYQNYILNEDDFVNNYKNIDIDIFVMNYSKRFLQRIRNLELHMIIICKEHSEMEECINIFEKSNTTHFQIILPDNLTSTEVIGNLTNLFNN